MSRLYDRIVEAVDFIKSKTDFRADKGIILGTGLSGLSGPLDVEAAIPYEDIPYFKTTSAPSHADELLFGRLDDSPVIIMSGRLHFYEGYSMKEVSFPVRVMAMLGIQSLLISNATGSTNEEYEMGDLVVIDDHINLHAENPLRGPNDDRLGVRFPDMSQPYNAEYVEWAVRFLKSKGQKGHTGTYFGWQGPNLETPAEYNFIHTVGGDVVGMSTIPEVIVARHMDVDVLVISVVTNVCYPPERVMEVSVEDVIEVAGQAAPHLQELAIEWLKLEY